LKLRHGAKCIWKEEKGMPYWEAPPDIIEDREQLRAWADKVYTVVLNSK